MEEPFWPPDENVASSRDDRGVPHRDAPPPVVHGEPVRVDPVSPPLLARAGDGQGHLDQGRPRDDQVGSPWSQPPAQALPGMEPGNDAGTRPANQATPQPPLARWPGHPPAGNGRPADPGSRPQVQFGPGIYRPADPTPTPATPVSAPPATPAMPPAHPAAPPATPAMPPATPPAPLASPEPRPVQPPRFDVPPAQAAPGNLNAPYQPPPAGQAYDRPEYGSPAHPAANAAPGYPPPHSPAPGVYQSPAYAQEGDRQAPVPEDWAAEGFVPTAEDFARRRAAKPVDPVATMGVRGIIRKSTLGVVNLSPGKNEQKHRHFIETVRRNFGGLRQVTVVNPKGGAGKTMAVLLLAMTFGQRRGGYVLAWDNNETQGTLGMRAQQDFHSRTVRDLLRDLDHFQGAHGRVGDLSQYVRAQGEGMFDVLASDESATAGEMLTAMAFADIREIVSRFYKLIFVDTGNNVRAENWQAAIDATDQLVVTMSARNDSAETAARMLDYLEQQGLHRLVRQAVTVVSMPPSRRELDIPAIMQHFNARTRTVLLAPYERLIDSGEPLRYNALSSATRNAWLEIAASVAEGL
jgi:MinD-like ATPase involved in chromosome partitioning or flagellar assembly